MKRLDEAGAAASAGEVEEKLCVGWTFCYLIYACERARDFDRAGQWCQKLKEFSERVSFRFTMGVCRAHYAGVLISRGEWSEAESELSSAAADLEASRPAQVAESLVRLAELRRRQGQFDEADRLFRRVEFHPLALLGRAELALDREDSQTAGELAGQYLRHIPADNRLLRVPALEILVHASIQLGERDRAKNHLTDLEAVVRTVPTDPMRGSFAFAEGLYLHATGDDERARQRLEDAVLHYERCKAPYESARARRELANVLHTLGRGESAREAAERALAVFEDIGALYETDQANRFLRSIVQTKRQKSGIPGTPDSLTPREVEVLRLVASGLGDKQIAAKLHLSEHTVHRHISNILTKLDVPTRAAAVARASGAGVL
jgi:ATP/maltotriose-dependent transcriptional regulator MalT